MSDRHFTHVNVSTLQVIEFVFTSVAIFYGDDCEFDNVTILEGDSDIIFGPYCGYSTPHTIVTTTNTATVLFKTDDIFQRDGFSVDFTAVGEDGNEGKIISGKSIWCENIFVPSNSLKWSFKSALFVVWNGHCHARNKHKCKSKISSLSHQFCVPTWVYRFNCHFS